MSLPGACHATGRRSRSRHQACRAGAMCAMRSQAAARRKGFLSLLNERRSSPPTPVTFLRAGASSSSLKSLASSLEPAGPSSSSLTGSKCSETSRRDFAGSVAGGDEGMRVREACELQAAFGPWRPGIRQGPCMLGSRHWGVVPPPSPQPRLPAIPKRLACIGVQRQVLLGCLVDGKLLVPEHGSKAVICEQAGAVARCLLGTGARLRVQ